LHGLGMLSTVIYYQDIRLPDTKFSGYQHGFVSGLMLLLKWAQVILNHKFIMGGGAVSLKSQKDNSMVGDSSPAANILDILVLMYTTEFLKLE